jgi:hypothetical protein
MISGGRRGTLLKIYRPCEEYSTHEGLSSVLFLIILNVEYATWEFGDDQ